MDVKMNDTWIQFILITNAVLLMFKDVKSSSFLWLPPGSHSVCFWSLFCLFSFLSQSCLAISGCQWQAWWFSCSCATCSMRFNEEFGGTRTTCVWLETWRLGELLTCSGVLAFILDGESQSRSRGSLVLLWNMMTCCDLERYSLPNPTLKSSHSRGM